MSKYVSNFVWRFFKKAPINTVPNAPIKVLCEYCSSWGYKKHASKCMDIILKEFPKASFDSKPIPGGTGCFEVTVNDTLVFSKLKTGTFIDNEAEFMESVRKAIK